MFGLAVTIKTGGREQCKAIQQGIKALHTPEESGLIDVWVTRDGEERRKAKSATRYSSESQPCSVRVSGCYRRKGNRAKRCNSETGTLHWESLD